MDKVEARVILRRELERWRQFGWSELKDRIGDIQVVVITGASGTEYQIEIEPIWDSKPNGPIRVLGAIDDGRFFSALSPVCDDFLASPDDGKP